MMILAVPECDLTETNVCAPSEVTELFEFRTPILEILGFPVTRSVVLIFLAARVVIALLFFGLRKKAAQPGKFQLSIDVGHGADEQQ